MRVSRGDRYDPCSGSTSPEGVVVCFCTGLTAYVYGGGFLKPAGSLSRELRPAWSMAVDVSQKVDEGVPTRQHLFVWSSFKV